MHDNIIDKKDREIYQYGTEQILINFSTLAVICIIAFCTNSWIQTVFLLCGMLPIRAVEETIYNKVNNEIEVFDSEGKSIESYKHSQEELSDVTRSSYTSQYPYITSLYDSLYGQYGFLYGEGNTTYGPMQTISISAGTEWSTAISLVLAVVLTGSTAVGILIAIQEMLLT